MTQHNKISSLGGIVLLLMMLLAFFFEEQLWGFHALSLFLLGENVLFYGLLTAILLILGLGYHFKVLQRIEAIKWHTIKYPLAITFSLTAFVFPIPEDFYGNARTLYGQLKVVHHEVAFWQIFKDIFSDHFLEVGRNLYRLVMAQISYVFQMELYEVYRVSGSICFLVFQLLAFRLIERYFKATKERLLTALMLLFSPALIIFYGHIESYPLCFILLTVWLILYDNFLKSLQLKKIFGLVFFSASSMIFHPFFVFLLLTSIFHLLLHSRGASVFKFKTTALIVLIPSIVFGLLLYFIVLQDHIDPRVLSDFDDIDRLFLPLFSPPPPLDRYNLFSFHHLLDFFNVSWLIAPALLIFFINGLYSRMTNHTNLQSNVLLMMMIVFIGFLFFVNPLLSMPMDWDLYMFPVMIVFYLTLENMQVFSVSPNKKLILLSCVFGALFYVMMLHPQTANRRVEIMARHIFKTYHEHSSTYMLYALKTFGSYEDYKQRMLENLESLEPHALIQHDKQYADLLYDYALALYHVENDIEKSRVYYERGLSYYQPTAELMKEFVYLK